MCLPIKNGLNYYMQSVCLNERAVRSRTPAEETRTQKCIYICHTEFSYLGMCTFFYYFYLSTYHLGLLLYVNGC